MERKIQETKQETKQQEKEQETKQETEQQETKQETEQQEQENQEEDAVSGQGRFSNNDIHRYLRNGSYPVGFSKTDKLVLRK